MSHKKKSAADKPLTVAEIANGYLNSLDSGKDGYKTADMALELLLEKCRDENCPTCGATRFKNNGVVKLPDGRYFRITDKFAGKNMTNVGQNVRRFGLEPTA